jgi:DNA-binding beta-propeller fold protein YncE
MKRSHFLHALATPLSAGIVELLGPAGRTTARSQYRERADGTGQFLEVAIYPAPGVNGFSRVQLWTSRREAGRYSRVRLEERELAIPQPLAMAKQLYEFNTAQPENRIAILSGGTDFTLRMLNPRNLSVSRGIPLAAQARQLALRPGNSREVWVSHAGASNQVSIVDPASERTLGAVPFRLNQSAVPAGLGFSPDGRTAYAVVRNPDSATDRGFVFVIDATARQLRSQVSLGATSPTAAVMAPDGSTLYIAGSSLNALNTPSPSITNFDTLTATPGLAAIGLPIAAEQLVAHPNGRLLYWAFPSTFGLDEYDVQQRRVVRRINLPRLIQPRDLDLTPGGDILLVRDQLGQQAAHIDTETGETLDTQAIPAGPGVAVVRV